MVSYQYTEVCNAFQTPIFLIKSQKQNKKLDTYTTAMNRLILLYEELSNNPKPTKKAETESQKIEKITDKLFEELEDLEQSKISSKSGKTMKTNLTNK